MDYKERELKLLLEQETYEGMLRNAAEVLAPLEQTNYYFDTPDFRLGKSGIMLRIRKENADWILCQKIKENVTSTFLSSIEMEQPVTEEIFEACKQQAGEMIPLLPEKGQQAVTNLISPSELGFRGSLSNKRYPIKLIDDYVFELDHTLFPDGNEQYELEIEGIKNEDEVETILRTLTQLGYTYTINKKGKYARFKEALERV
ncbi:CYTH domain-containing protein [Aneurinibacillus tyrosinisolvens]|uniref:CYTH domain-containing protein n=1 Tax=Aneurinibacillus tyrosinisolvens TaxID=1443435 RepID=UPI00063FC0E9|nr:CYTH domain-containing protein [Aneurinibacillus tyrosinisolvens]